MLQLLRINLSGRSHSELKKWHTIDRIVRAEMRLRVLVLHS